MERVTNLDSVGQVCNDEQIEIIEEVDLDEDEMIDIGMPVQMRILSHTQKELERRQYIGSVALLCCVVHALHLHQLSRCLHSRVTNDTPQRERRRKAPMADLMEDQLERMTSGIGLMADALNKGNCISKQLHDVEKQQIAIAERRVAAIEKRNEILQHSRPRVYTAADVWDMLSELNLLEQFRLQCYEFLCSDDKKKELVFGVPAHLRLQVLFQVMNVTGHHVGSM